MNNFVKLCMLSSDFVYTPHTKLKFISGKNKRTPQLETDFQNLPSNNSNVTGFLLTLLNEFIYILRNLFVYQT